MGRGSGTQTTTQQTNYAPWIGQAQQGAGGSGFGLNQHFLIPSSYAVAGFNPDQMKAFDSARHSLLQYGPGGQTVPGADALMRGGTATPGQSSAMMAHAAQMGPNEATPFINPFLQSVLDPALANMRRQKNETAAEIGARAAASSAFGGSGEALQKAQLDRSHGENVASLASNLMAQGYDRAQAMAMANAQMRQQAEMQNAQMGTQSNMQNAALQTQTSLANANNALAAYGMHNNLQNSDLQRQLATIQMLAGMGQQQQNLAQTAIDVPHYALERWLSTIPRNVYDSSVTATQPDNSPGRGQQMLGLGASILPGLMGGGAAAGAGPWGASLAGAGALGGAFPAAPGIGGLLSGLAGFLPFLSDEREKTDLRKVGKDDDTGLNLYSYRYKGDPKDYPKIVGPMAQEVEKKFPDQVREVGGRKVVASGLLGSLMERNHATA